MNLYQLQIAPGEYEAEGENHDEWFASLDAARERRRRLIAEDPELKDHRFGRDFEISRIAVADLPLRALLLKVLNRTGWQRERSVVVPAYYPKRKR